jgi:hypothetical protein
MNLIIYVFMNRRETLTAKTIRESFYGLILLAEPTRMTSYKDDYLWWRSWWAMEQPANSFLDLFIYYMLINVVNLVKYGVFILLVVVMFF